MMLHKAHNTLKPRLLLVAAIAVAGLVALVVTGGSQAVKPGEATLTPSPTLARVIAHSTGSNGLTPAMLHSAYSLPNRAAKPETVAIVAAYGDPHLQSDLATFSRRFGLPSCTVGNHCLRFLNEAGQKSPLPIPDPTNGTWNVEHAQSAESIHALCQNCSLLVVEAATDSEYDLSTAVHAAAKAQARVIVTTFGPAQTGEDSQWASDYNNPKSIVVAAAGDTGYGSVDFPSTFPNVLAVGGTHLVLGKKNRYVGETAWSMGTSGCSAYTQAASWQKAQAKSVGCGTSRALVDVSAVADPGLITYITDGGGTPGGAWYEAGGTSLSAPIIGAVFGLAHGGGSSALPALYRAAEKHPRDFHDVRSGSDSSSCGGKSICSARRGYDGPTGWGTPNGLAAFK